MEPVRFVGRVQLNLNSLGSIRFSLTPKASDGLLEYGLLVLFASWEPGRAFSSLTSAPLATGPFRDVNGSRNGGIGYMRDTMWEVLDRGRDASGLAARDMPATEIAVTVLVEEMQVGGGVSRGQGWQCGG